MKQKIFNLSMLLLFMIVGLGSAKGQEDALVKAGTNGSSAVVNGKSGIKVGTSSKGGDLNITVPAGATQLEFYAAAWKGVSGLSINITPSDNVEKANIELSSDAGISNSSPFTLIGNEDDYKYTIDLKNISQKTTFTFKSSADKRFVLWGAVYYGVTTNYSITIDEGIAHGRVESNSSTAERGKEVTLTAIPDDGYMLAFYRVTNNYTGEKIIVEDNKFEMPSSDVTVSAMFKKENEEIIIYDFNDKNAYPANFPIGGTNIASSETIKINGNDIVVNAPDNYYSINSSSNETRGLFFGKTVAKNGIPSDGTAYLGFPAKEGYKLTKVSVTTTAGVAGSVKMNIYDASWNAMSKELSTTVSTKKEFVFNLTSSAVNTEYRLASGSSGKNLQIDNIVLIYEEDPVFTSQTLSLKAEDKDGYWATFSSDKVTFFPNDVTVNTVVVENGIVNLLAGEDGVLEEDIIEIDEKTVDGYYVPANTGVLVYSVETPVTYYEVEYKTVEEVDADFNMLRPASVEMETNGSYKFYKLSYKSAAKDALGFYYGVDGGAAFTMSNPNVAYLAVPSSSAGNVKAFVIAGSSTGVETVATKTDANAPIYNVAGQRVSSVTKGLYIQNGKKVFVK